MKIELSTSSINEVLRKVDFLKDNINVATEEVVIQLVNKGGQVATQLNASAPQSGLTKSVVYAETTEHNNKGYIALIGDSAVYDEFGTGTEGQNNPHPMKNNFGLNPYNSGPYIFYNQFAGVYQWRYYPMAGKPYFTETGLTQGIPSGKQIYNTSVYLRKIKDDVIQKNFAGAIKKANKD